jgi:hypothetical protein
MKRIAFFKISVFTFLLSAVLLTSCEVEDSSDVNQDKIYADYELFYNSNTDKTQAVARFRFGGPTGTLLELSDPASVTFDGEELPFNALFSGHVKEYSGKLEEGDFLYTNVDGETFENSVPTYNEIDFPEDMDTISKTTSYDLLWQGSSLGANEFAGVFLGSWTWGQDALAVQGTDEATSIVIGTNNMSNLATGNSTAILDRWTEVDLDEGTSEGGKIRGKFRTNNIEVIIIP